MTDPAVEAAQRAWPKGNGARKLVVNRPRMYMEAAAREALRPIQEWFGKVMLEAVIEDLYEQLDLLESLHPLIFTTEELER
ncbi:Uncharacterised protein [Mycobacteroides abscessus subsp. abscessus]|uniref:Uncharacterized protein n=1 Tax=Mycobacteroides abscessus TaxID=36809 RepID=A0AB33T2M9_9MYCO|nr:hypothetical protein [Mycobacteroides abscessus]CPT12373.1 Uncharacterised protein [Mycobacteroides abscessus]CPT21053.1 Uncharacterised protein [Mycobacteroides abscessus]CPT25651.1 Uncharacterised protein [Mycobacteroides abscessus]CPU73410.1 Uncharacterised protein [Mycobacteroides abscessus]CPV25877.1 Uncharacterised protein [Mycobacteroides abscessus]